MALLQNYRSVTSGNYRWTGINTLNQSWSYFYVPEPIIIDRIDVNWGGYDRATSGRHFIAKVDGVNASKLRGLVVASNMINVPQGRAWRSASVPETFLEAGHYAVGVWGDPKGRRIYANYPGDRGTTQYEALTISGLNATITGKPYKSVVIPSRLRYELAGRVKIRAGGSWRNGNCFVKVGGVWRRAKSIWVKVGGTWRQSK
jgi:hypothetical protein